MTIRTSVALLGTLLLLPSTRLIAQSAEDSIRWADSLQAAQEQSARDGRPVIAYFTFET